MAHGGQVPLEAFMFDDWKTDLHDPDFDTCEDCPFPECCKNCSKCSLEIDSLDRHLQLDERYEWCDIHDGYIPERPCPYCINL